MKAIYYDGLVSRPREARVEVREPDALQVDVLDADGREEDRFYWPLEDKGLQWERSAGALRLSFGAHPRRVVIVREELFIRAFVQRMQYTGRRGVYDRLVSTAGRGPILFFLGVIALLVAGYLWVIPWGAERLALLMPRDMDRELGEMVYTSMADELKVDSARTAALQAFGDALRLSDHYELKYHVVDDPQVNAFALPGGHIVVFTGILEKMDRPEQLAGLLAHEATHVEARHSMRALVRGMGSYLFLSLLLGDVSAVVGTVAQHADNIRNLGYSRALETEADAVGQQRMHANGVDPQGMVWLLELLEEEAGDLPEAVSFLSSHPLTKERIEKAEERAQKMGAPAQVDTALAAPFRVLKGKEE